MICPLAIALWVKGAPCIKRCKKKAKVNLCFSSKKNHLFIFAALFEFLMSQICHRKKLDDYSAENLIKITEQSED